MTSHFDPYTEWLGVASPERPPNYYTMLGIDPAASSDDEIQNAFSQRVERIRIYQVGARGTEAQRVLDELSTAFRVLTNPDKRREYDEELADGNPWQLVVSLLRRYAAGDVEALDQAESVALETSPEDGPLHLARCALEQGIDEPRFRETLDSHAKRRHAIACDACYAFVDRPPNPTETPVVLTHSKLSSPGLSISVRTQKLLREAKIVRGELPWDAPQPAPSLDRSGALLLAGAGPLLLSLPFLWTASVNTQVFLFVGAIAFLLMMVAALATQLLYHPRFESAHDVAWLVVVPVVLHQRPSADVSSFLAGLAKASIGSGDHRVRRDNLKAAIDTQTEWAGKGLVSHESALVLHRVALLDCMKAGDSESFSAPPLSDLLRSCFDGDYSLGMVDRVTSNGKLLHMLSPATLASTRLAVLAECRDKRLSTEDLRHVRERSATLRVLFEREPELDENTLATLLATVNLRQWREPQVPATSAFELAAAGNVDAFRKWPDLILDGHHRDIVLCGRGVHFEGLFFHERPVIHRATGNEDMTIVINGRYRRSHVSPQIVARLQAFCDFCFGTLATKAERLRSQPASPDAVEQLFTEFVRCTRCGEKTKT